MVCIHGVHATQMTQMNTGKIHVNVPLTELLPIFISVTSTSCPPSHQKRGQHLGDTPQLNHIMATEVTYLSCVHVARCPNATNVTTIQVNLER